MYIPIEITDIDGEEIVTTAVDLDTLEVVRIDAPLKELSFSVPESGSQVRRTKDGVRWMAITTNTLLDSQKERFTTKALQHAIDFSEQHHGMLDELRLEHHPSSRVGIVDARFLLGGYLVEMGKFDDTSRAKKVIGALEASPDRYKVSVGFLYDQKHFKEGIYEDGVRIYERSITDHPANPWTAIGVIDYAEKRIKEVGMAGDIRAKLIELVGEEEADKILQVPAVDQQLKELYGALKFKFEAEEEAEEKAEEKTTPRARAKATPDEEEKKPKKEEYVKPEATKAELSDADMKRLAAAIGRIKDPKDRAMMMKMHQDMGLIPESYGEFAKPEEEEKKKALPSIIEIEVDGKKVKAQLVEDDEEQEKSLNGAVDKIVDAIGSLDEQLKALKTGMKAEIDAAIEDYVGNLPRVVKYRATQDTVSPKPKVVIDDPHEARMQVLRSIRPGS